MSRFWKGVAAVAVLSVLGAAVSAQEAKRVEEKRLSLRLEKAEASDVLAHLARALDARLDYECEHPASVSISFERLTPKTAVAAVCESAGLEWRLVEGPPRVLAVICAAAPAPRTEGGQRVEVEVRKEKDAETGDISTQIALQVKDAKLDEVLRLAADLIGARLLMGSSLGEKTVTLHVEKAPLSQVLDAICVQVGARWELAPGEPPTLKVDAK